MNGHDDAAPDTQADPQTHLDTDPVNRPDTEDDPEHGATSTPGDDA